MEDKTVTISSGAVVTLKGFISARSSLELRKILLSGRTVNVKQAQGAEDTSGLIDLDEIDAGLMQEYGDKLVQTLIKEVKLSETKKTKTPQEAYDYLMDNCKDTDYDSVVEVAFSVMGEGGAGSLKEKN